MISVTYVDKVDLTFAEHRWPFSEDRRADILRHFEQARSSRPSLWNGRLLLMHEFEFSDRGFRGAYFETGFAELLAWRDWGFPDLGIRNCYAQAALRGSDGGFVLGVMAEHTANAGQAYFPSGTPDRSDIVGYTVDLEASVARELREETGLEAGAFDIDPGWYAVHQPPRIAMMKVMQARETASAVQERILRFLATQTDPELCEILIARGPHDIDARVQPYAAAFLRHVWRV